MRLCARLFPSSQSFSFELKKNTTFESSGDKQHWKHAICDKYVYFDFLKLLYLFVILKL